MIGSSGHISNLYVVNWPRQGINRSTGIYISAFQVTNRLIANRVFLKRQMSIWGCCPNEVGGITCCTHGFVPLTPNEILLLWQPLKLFPTSISHTPDLSTYLPTSYVTPAGGQQNIKFWPCIPVASWFLLHHSSGGRRCKHFYGLLARRQWNEPQNWVLGETNQLSCIL